ncbi:glucose-6-phosphate 1-dehydrogenase [Bacteroides sedimenti]|uniref:Glucose-6-phosphate 1-dehydrogenase n=2 Tax=Bacteroides sedimenti TaxID=2136147 RepID=A0ABM8IF09_9BACE
MDVKMKPQSLVMVIFGASGDLTRRKLIPALYLLYKHNRLPENFAILGVARTAFTDDEFRERIHLQLLRFVKPEDVNEEKIRSFVSLINYFPMDPADPDEYLRLQPRLLKLDQMIGNGENYIYYLATPPSLYGVIPQYLKNVGLNLSKGPKGNKRIIVEKPFGYDLESALELNNIYYKDAFREDQIFRIDHYLGKETVQNILALRFANTVFEPVWNRNYIDYVEVTAVENMGIEQRGGYFDDAGTLRDMVQNHLIQLVALTAMEPPTAFNPDSFRDELAKVYQSLTPLTEKDINQHIIRGQYTASEGRKAYREEKDVAPDSRTETFLAMKLSISNWRWSGVPFYIRTGKQMPTKVSEIVVHFKPTPFPLFNCAERTCPTANLLIIRIQPNEGIVLKFGLKVPGSGFDVKQVAMDFSYSSLGPIPTEDAYARLIEDCILGDSTLFTRSDAVEACWKYFTPVLEYWKNHPESPLYGYPAGTWGPREADMLIQEQNAEWSNPCKNLTNTELYCEL